MRMLRDQRFKKFSKWIGLVFNPLFGGFGVLFFVLLAVCIFYGVRVDFLDISPKENLIRVEGRFLVPQDLRQNRRAQYSTRVLGDDGVVYKCDCSFGGISGNNCLEQDYLANIRFIEQLKNQRVVLLLDRGIMGGADICYELSNVEKKWFSYEEKSEKYMAIKNGWYSFFSWVLLFFVVMFFIVRGIFVREE